MAASKLAKVTSAARYNAIPERGVGAAMLGVGGVGTDTESVGYGLRHALEECVQRRADGFDQVAPFLHDYRGQAEPVDPFADVAVCVDIQSQHADGVVDVGVETQR